MKIGILTVHRAINVGAVLQCYALQETLRSLGHEVKVINYIQEKVERTDRKKYDNNERWKMLKKGHLRGALFYNIVQKSALQSYKRFDIFIERNLNLTEPCTKKTIPSDFDAYIIGSDQVWNSNIFGYNDLIFWGHFSRKPNSKLISYAPSTSVNNLKNIDRTFVESSLSKFDKLSVREKEAGDYLNDQFSLHTHVQTVLDPTLIANPNIWNRFLKNTATKNEDSYVLVYGARGGKEKTTAIMKQAQFLASKLECRVKLLHYDTIENFLFEINNAKYVVTSSFHGVAFSLIFNTPLFAIKYGDEQDARYVNLLTSIGASHLLSDIHKPLHPQKIDYAKINSSLRNLRKDSIEYLKYIDL